MMLTRNEKKCYLSGYTLQQAKINRLRAQMLKNPDRREVYKATLHRAERLREKMEREIAAVDDGLLSELLSLKYQCGLSLEQVAENLNYSKRQIERLHLKALDKFNIF